MSALGEYASRDDLLARVAELESEVASLRTKLGLARAEVRRLKASEQDGEQDG